MQASVGEFLKPRVVKVTPTTARQAKVVIEPFRARLWTHAGQRPAPRVAVFHAGLRDHRSGDRRCAP